ncbi:glutathione S-transferase family protein [Aureimonas leprariae]|uniref:Glutathione S-transferase n=1 Tax=Plantimonas leprariae TaxID=2615207 RepID=A0A7V7TWX7_9HYPH|nr:glutathione S-transferase [Aureimonas leprariae]KAB0680686.1 glutathione S-transferase [Aureimonas leprariae]
MRLLYSGTSPYSAKVRMAARLCGIALDETVVDTTVEPDELTSVNPLGKIPALVLDDGQALYDSPVICEYLDRQSGNRIVPQTNAEWLAAKRLEALADGVVDAAILIVYENRFRPEEIRHQPSMDKQWRRAERGLAAIEREIGEVPAEPTVGHLAVAAMAGWLDIRFADRWDANHAALRDWAQGFYAAFPALADVKPKV